MENRPVWFVSEKIASVRRRRFEPARHLHAGRTRSPIVCTALLIFAPLFCFGQGASPTPSPSEMEAEPIVVTATRFDIPLELSPASASVITSEDFEQKQIERVSDALREVPGLS